MILSSNFNLHHGHFYHNSYSALKTKPIQQQNFLSRGDSLETSIDKKDNSCSINQTFQSSTKKFSHINKLAFTENGSEFIEEQRYDYIKDHELDNKKIHQEKT